MTDENEIINQLKLQEQELRGKNAQLTTAMASAYQGQEDQNFLQYQLETAEMLSKIEHFIRGDVIKIDQEGNEYYAKQKDKKLILFNQYGVNSIMSIMGNYIDKGTILSFYDEMRINEILADLGDELTNFIFCNYEKMGMDTEFKRSRFNLVVINILHSIESAYRRAIGGKALIQLNSSTIFTQQDLTGNRAMPGVMPKKKFNLFDRKTW